MEEVSVRELRNYGGQILDRVEGGESMTITRDGKPVARLIPLPHPRLTSTALLERWRNVPAIDGDALRDDISQVLDLDL
ncbi:MAG: type II toxin-antitoxin system prevent-host-death family antitoxin [Candidatus Nanopelagicales bacterium]|jgi:prevent-host-death family protein|nr:type II toxin-antitoxin system prevent-host-death family antitoxin [Candidatus Nanopelagicales bacterium]